MTVRHVLVVDDSKSARLMLRKILQGLGMTVDMAESAEDALNYLRAQRPDAIFMDHTMPGMDGLEALRRIKNDPATVQIPVAMYTSKDEPAYRNEAQGAGAIDVLTKPATSQALGALLERMNALLDAAPPPAAPPPTGEGITAESIEKLILEKSEQVFYNAVESQVLPLINDVIAKLRLEWELNQEEVSNRIAAQVVETRLARWQPPPVDAQGAVETVLRSQLPPLLEERLKTFQREGRPEAEQLFREIAAQICQNQLHTFTNQLVTQLSTRFAEALQKAEVAVHEAAVATARETALAVTRETASQAVAEAHAASTSVEESPAAAAAASAAAVQEARNMLAEAQHDWQRRMYLTAAGAAAVGIGAALLVYVLK
jgi:CheY-like chemotaxis protein